MFTTKVKIAMLCIVGALIGSIPYLAPIVQAKGTAETNQRSRDDTKPMSGNPSDKKSKEEGKSKTQLDTPAWKTEFRKIYGLKEGELIRRVAPPYPDCRVEYFKDQIREWYKRSKQEIPGDEDKIWDRSNYFTKFGWKGDWPNEHLTMHQVPVLPEEGVALGHLIHMTTGFRPIRTYAEGNLHERKVTGDFVVRANADLEKLVKDFEKILRKECDLAVSLAIEEKEQDVYVLSGKYESKPLADRKKNRIEIYSFRLTDPMTGGGGGATLQGLADHIEGFIDFPVMIGEVKDAPKQVEFHFNERSPATDLERAQDRDPEEIMKNISAQTGLTAKLEKRKIKMLTVKESK